MRELLEYVPINFISLCILGALLLRRVVRMDGHHWLRVVILTGLLWVPTIILFLLSWAQLIPPYHHSCTMVSDEPRLFYISEY